ncbi:cupin domain-containing protein [Paenibacillus roseipurpureus]|uniref:AraC family ligand binding domain-containing protein n=1 Tax=Paenibacillus roseopurpureus TaxID=2918901 RepID=A0AA96RNQ2_9BACL|nr:AraC family ligand binding domain-containing protein [Paenibacillus sp. MBLB1832]WNR45772.1 AraC family ligand binding domain-containing protein [Paenibacillus sp. MBLB1832]
MFIRKSGYYADTAGMEMENGGIHPYSELLYIVAGNALLTWAGKDYTVQAQDLILLPPNTPHELNRLSPGLSYYYLELDLAGDVAFPDTKKARIWCELQSVLDRASPLIRMLHGSLQLLGQLIQDRGRFPSTIFNSYVQSELSNILLSVDYVLRSATPTTADGNTWEAGKRNIVDTLMSYMESHYKENSITLQTLVSLVHLIPLI